MFSPVNTVVDTALIDSSVIASFEVALAGIAIKLLTIINGNHAGFKKQVNFFRPK